MATPLNLDALVPRRPRVQGIGLVKAVLSGDTIVVAGSAKNGPPTEKRLILANVTSPKFGQGKDEKDEPFAYHAREFLRERVLGKVVQFVLPGASVETATNLSESSKQDFAEVTFNNVNLSELMITSGYAKVMLPKPKAPKEGKDGKPASDKPTLTPEKEALLKLQEEAQKQKLGMFATNCKSVRALISADGKQNVELFKKYVGKELPAYVDYVINGSTLRLEIKTNPQSLEHTMVTFNLAGVESPQPPVKAKTTTKTDKAGKETTDKRDALPGEPFGAEARQYTVDRLQGHDVKILIQAIDNDQRLYGTVLYPKGNISKNLLADGFARYVPWSAMATNNNTELKLAASQSKVNMALTSPYAEQSRVQYEASVVQINSGDSLTVRCVDNTEKRIYLASIRAPRMGKGDKNDDFAFESKEFLRRSLIGKKVIIQTEYVLQEKPAADKKAKVAEGENDEDVAEKKQEPEGEKVIKNREYVSMFKGKFNIAAELLANGLADIVPTPRDAPRSLYLAELCSAQIKAQAEKKHKWAEGKQPLQLHDLNPRVGQSKEANAINKTNEERVEIHFRKLQGSSIAAVLDAVYSPTRFRVFVPTLNTFFGVKLAVVSTPVVEKDQPKPLVLDQAIVALKKHLQHDITLEVTHRMGLTLVANILNRESKENLGLSMVQNGQASIIMPAVEKNKYKKEFLAAQEFAKKQHLGIWIDFDEQKEKEELERQKLEAQDTIGAGVVTKDGDNYINVLVTDVNDSVHFYVNNVDDKSVAEINAQMAAFDSSVPVPEKFEPKEGDILAGLFEEDNQWYRVKIQRVLKSRNTCEVQFIDYGNQALVPQASLRPLSPELQKIRQSARPCTLSGVVQPDPSSEWFEVGANALSAATVNKQFQARIDFTEKSNGVLHLTLLEDGEKSVNQRMVEEGLVLVNQRPMAALQRVLGELEESEVLARFNHKGLFEYGDYTIASNEKGLE
jgi:staphylococcal nuclease domain-containing protein 1